MSLKAQPVPPVPAATASAARAAFRKGNVYMQMRDELGSIYTDDLFADLYPVDGQPALAPWRLALVTVMQFAVDWEAQSVTCPAGQRNVVWAQGLSQYGTPVIRVHFSPAACRICDLRPRCTRGLKRGLTLRLRVVHEALQCARQREQTDAFWATYRKCAGVEGTVSQAVRVCGMRRSRYIGLAKTHLHCVAAAAAVNLFRAINWLNEVPLAATRTSHLAALAA